MFLTYLPTTGSSNDVVWRIFIVYICERKLTTSGTPNSAQGGRFCTKFYKIAESWHPYVKLSICKASVTPVIVTLWKMCRKARVQHLSDAKQKQSQCYNYSVKLHAVSDFTVQLADTPPPQSATLNLHPIAHNTCPYPAFW